DRLRPIFCCRDTCLMLAEKLLQSRFLDRGDMATDFLHEERVRIYPNDLETFGRQDRYNGSAEFAQSNNGNSHGLPLLTVMLLMQQQEHFQSFPAAAQADKGPHRDAG